MNTANLNLSYMWIGSLMLRLHSRRQVRLVEPVAWTELGPN